MASIVSIDASQLLIVDMQSKLSLAMQTEAMQAVTKQVQALAQTAQRLSVPLLLTEQYPQGLGHTLPEILQHAPQAPVIEKTAFSACAAPKFNAKLSRDKSQVILVGMEAHICVLQAAFDLLAQHKQVFVVEDAIISRAPTNHANAIARMREAGCIITNTESVLFEWIGNAQHEAFKDIAKLVR
ncbi:nicotinamidase-like amidase [Methylophilaceae bacterium 11]|nr:nicotinamidase-like amidase [Methylophilaceae bacterium 11]